MIASLVNNNLKKERGGQNYTAIVVLLLLMSNAAVLLLLLITAAIWKLLLLMEGRVKIFLKQMCCWAIKIPRNNRVANMTQQWFCSCSFYYLLLFRSKS